MKAEQLAEIEARANRATPGPWQRDGCNGGEFYCVLAKNPGHLSDLLCTMRGRSSEVADSDFIAHARTDIPLLIAALRERESEIESLRAECESLNRQIENAWAKNLE